LGTGLWKANPKVEGEPSNVTVSVPLVGCENVGMVKPAWKKHPDEVVQLSEAIGIWKVSPPMFSV